MDVNLILKVAGEQTKTVDNGFWRSECAETRSNGSEACPHEQYDYVSRVGSKLAFPVGEGSVAAFW